MSAAHDDRSIEVKAVAAAFMSVACVTVILRCYVRVFVVKGFGWDDAAMVMAMIFYLMFSGCMIGGSLYGTGKRFAVLTAHERVTAMKYWWLCEIAYCFASVFCKISVCIFLMRITVRRIDIWILYIVMILTVIAGIVFMFLMLLQCKPLSYFWTSRAFDPNIHGSCIDIEVIIAMTYVYSAFAALCDFTCGTLPIFLVRKLHMRRQNKIAVVGILSMACIASAAVIIRIPWVKTFRDYDFLYATVEIALWSNIETGLGISAGSLATLRPLLRHIRGTTKDDEDDYYTSPMPGQSSSRRRGARGSSGGRKSRDRAVPLATFDGDFQGRFRPDKLAVTLTTVQGQGQGSSEADSRYNRNHRPWSGSGNTSEEQLNADQPVVAAGSSSEGDGDISGMAIHRRFEVTQTTSSGRDSGSR